MVKEAASYKYDPHLDPQLIWAGKEERDEAGLTVDTVSLHIHERVSTPQIIAQARREEPKQLDLFADPHLPIREAIEFYQHDVDWSNRLVLGDSLLVMNSLLEREGMAGKVQMIYIDPPYGVNYNSNFQPAMNRRDVRHGDDGSLTREPEMIQAYRDTWRLGIHSYLTYLRDRLKIARELLHESGSIFVQIGDENVHLVQSLLDEIFGRENYLAIIAFNKPGQRSSDTLPILTDFILWFCKDRKLLKYYQLFAQKELSGSGGDHYSQVELRDSSIRPLTRQERLDPSVLPMDARVFETTSATSAGAQSGVGAFAFQGRTYQPPPHKHWSASVPGMQRLANAGRLVPTGASVRYKRYFDDFAYMTRDNRWDDAGLFGESIYVVQTSTTAIERCILMTTDPGDLVLDPTCGSGTAAYIAEQWGRRWVTCDSSRVALNLARQRLLTASFPYYRLAYPEAGVSAGFQYETVPHITLKSIAQNTRLDGAKTQEERERVIREDAEQETLYDKPLVDRSKVRVSGPFTVEGIPVPAIAIADESPIEQYPEREDHDGRIDLSATDYIDTLIGLLRKDGVTFAKGKKLSLTNLRPVSHPAIHAEAEVEDEGRAIRVAVSFGPQYGPVTARQVETGARSARLYDLLIFAGFAFDSAAQAFIQENPDPNLRMELAHIRPDVQLEDLLKVTANSQLFSVFGQPDVKLTKQREGTYLAELRGVDVYDPSTGEVHSSDGRDVAAWFLDSDYDGRTFGICQALFPGDKDAWKKLQRALKGQIPEERFEAMRGTTSLPFPAGEHRTTAVKVIDFRGNEVIRITHLDDVF